MAGTEDPLTPLDSSFLELEQGDECSLMHIGGALMFDHPLGTGRAPTLEQLHELLDERLDLLPRFRRRLSEPRVHGLRRPVWVEDPAFDLGAHLRHATLPAPGGAGELHEWLADFWSHRLDRARPLWEMTLVDGLWDGGWMLATKTHHAMVDGVGSIDIGHILLDPDPHPALRPRSRQGRTQPRNGNGAHVGDWLPVRIAETALDAARHPSHLVRAGQAAVAMGEVLWHDEIMAAPDSTLNVPIGATRRFASVAFELSDVKEIKRALGGTVNDVVLAVSAGALRRLLDSRGEKPTRPLRAMVPVNTRGDDHGSLGNKVTSLFVELPIDVADTRRRYEAARAAASRLKSGTAALGTSTLLQIIGAAPPLLHEQISRTLIAPRLFNLTITNVPGPQIPLYALGSRMRRILPLVPLFADHAVGIAIVSYDGELVFGINADYAATPDLNVLEASLHSEFAALLSVARPPLVRGRPRQRDRSLALL